MKRNDTDDQDEKWSWDERPSGIAKDDLTTGSGDSAGVAPLARNNNGPQKAQRATRLESTSTANVSSSVKSSGPAGRVLLVAALFVTFLIAGILVVTSVPSTYSTRMTLVVVPNQQVSVDEAASLFDSLSRGQVVATAAEVLEQDRWRPGVPEMTIAAGSIVPSSVVQVTASGQAPNTLKEGLAEAVARATPEVNRLLAPYRIVELDPPTDPRSVGLTRPLQYFLVLLAALLAAVAATLVLTRARAWFRRSR